MLVTVVTLISSHVKDKNSIFTAHDEYMIFQQKKNSWYFISIYIIKLFNLQSWTKLDKITCLESIFSTSKLQQFFPPPPTGSSVVVSLKESLIPGRLQEATLDWGKGLYLRKAIDLETVLLRKVVRINKKTFSSSFVRDCSLTLNFL